MFIIAFKCAVGKTLVSWKGKTPQAILVATRRVIVRTLKESLNEIYVIELSLS